MVRNVVFRRSAWISGGVRQLLEGGWLTIVILWSSGVVRAGVGGFRGARSFCGTFSFANWASSVLLGWLICCLGLLSRGRFFLIFLILGWSFGLVGFSDRSGVDVIPG